MKNRAIMFGVAMFILVGCTGEDLSGVDESNPTPPEDTQQTQPEDTLQPGDGPKLTFDVPEGWEFHPETKLKARRNQKPKDSVLSFVMLDVMTWRTGTPEDAKAKAQEHYENQKGSGEDPILTEMKVDDIQMYVIEVHTDSYWGAYWWNTNIVFHKDGHVGSITITDRYENQKEVIATVINTLGLTK